jgi:hypothetical protein
MIWERDPLWAKSKLFFERAFAEPPDNPLYGLWCSLGLELLGRAAISSVSPTLLAEPDQDQRFILYAVNRAPGKTSPRSIGAAQVFSLCATLFDSFSTDDLKAAQALVNRRNAELHSAEDAFDQYPTRIWLPGFYRICNSLALELGESIESLFGPEQATVAREILKETETEATSRVQSTIAAHRRVFEAKSPEDRELAAAAAADEASKLSHMRHHRVTCPACGCDASVQGELFGQDRVTHEEGQVVVRRSISPRTFSCSACELKLNGYSELAAAGLGGYYSRRKTYSPEEYFGLIDPATADLTPYIESYLEDMAADAAYDNE